MLDAFAFAVVSGRLFAASKTSDVLIFAAMSMYQMIFTYLDELVESSHVPYRDLCCFDMKWSFIVCSRKVLAKPDSPQLACFRLETFG